jgi:hypothetical protein
MTLLGLLLALSAWGACHAATGDRFSDETLMARMVDYTRGRLRFESKLAQGE